MKIVAVEYRRLHSFGNYENETVGATAQVEDGRTPEDALSYLRTWVAMRLSDSGEISTLKGEINELRWKKDDLERRIARMQGKWDEIMAFLARFGIERPAEVPGDLSEILSPEPDDQPDEALKELPF